MDDETTYKTTDLHLAAWLMCQPGVECLDIETRMVRARDDPEPRPKSTFVLGLDECPKPLKSMLQSWRSCQALAEVHQYEQERASLLGNMKTLHRELQRNITQET